MSDQLSSDLASLRIQRDEPPAKSKLGTIVTVATILVAVGAAWVFGKPYMEAKIFRPEIQTTEIMVVSPAEASVDLTSAGYVIAETTSKVGAKIEGRLAKVHVKENDVVKAGQLIAELEASDEESQLATARARMAAAKARVETARATLAEQRIQFERQKSLAERGAAPKATAQDLEARVKSLEESARATEAEVSASEMEMRSLGVRLQHTKVLAPINGTIVEKIAEVGELVGPAKDAIVEVADFSTLIVEIDVPEGRLHRVKPKGPCEIVLDAYPGRRYRGETVEIVPRVNRAKATVPVKVRFVDEPEGVLPNMAARVSFLQKELDAEAMKEPPRTVVPLSAVVERGGSKVVFIVDGEQVRMSAVTVGPPFGGGLELKHGPLPGTKLVKNPPETMTDGQRVKERK